MNRARSLSAGLLALSLAAAGCYGPFNLTRRLYQWNQQVGTKWEQEFMFILLAWAPVYGLAVLGDAIIFNSMEFWTGKNPVDPPTRQAMSQTKRLVRGDQEAHLTYSTTTDGLPEFFVEQFDRGQPAASLRIQQRDGLTESLDAAGNLLFIATTRPDGEVRVHDRTGRLVASSAWGLAQEPLTLARQDGVSSSAPPEATDR